MRIVINGSNGLIGSYLKNKLPDYGHNVVTINRDKYNDIDYLKKIIRKNDVFINLAGKNIFCKWTKNSRIEILQSRVNTTKFIVEALNYIDKKKLLINFSAIGIYDSVNIHNENSLHYGKNFLSEVVYSWESALKELNPLHRLCIFRLGVVLSSNSKLIKIYRLLLKFGIIFYFGDGKQKFSFIHIDDLVRVINYVFRDLDLNGVINVVAPEASSNKLFSKTILACFTKQKLLLKIPSGLLKFIMGDSFILFTEGQHVVPEKLIKHEFNFKYNTLKSCIENI